MKRHSRSMEEFPSRDGRSSADLPYQETMTAIVNSEQRNLNIVGHGSCALLYVRVQTPVHDFSLDV